MIRWVMASWMEAQPKICCQGLTQAATAFLVCLSPILRVSPVVLVTLMKERKQCSRVVLSVSHCHILFDMHSTPPPLINNSSHGDHAVYPRGVTTLQMPSLAQNSGSCVESVLDMNSLASLLA